ncbi:predicted protein [Lichtheimia corymbifera JMRC:FSU:9682]|uniref:Uncharacterized protein n=1 Tax=Lichtheimia corymbifera JMRC:FSU:9682 TaxID=1263082 RepID=A0A068SDZ8_9FUNG|nr:predicted protein [Lichtheimia corymbifera JMRC:FSU:9682]
MTEWHTPWRVHPTTTPASLDTTCSLVHSSATSKRNSIHSSSCHLQGLYSNVTSYLQQPVLQPFFTRTADSRCIVAALFSCSNLLQYIRIIMDMGMDMDEYGFGLVHGMWGGN